MALGASSLEITMRVMFVSLLLECRSKRIVERGLFGWLLLRRRFRPGRGRLWRPIGRLLDREADAAARRVHLDHLDLDALADLDHLRRIFDEAVRQLRDV